MTFPQTSPELAITKGQDYWRLFTQLKSSGDIYETEQSGRGFVIGPDSDVSRVKLTYFDANEPSRANNIIVSVDKPLIGRLDALASQTYPSGERARILISHADLSVPVFSGALWAPPTAAKVAGTSVETILPNIDLIQYFGEAPSFIPPRTDKVHQWGQITNISDDHQWFCVPFYGRRFADVCVKTLGIGNPSTTPAVNVYVYGINFSWIIFTTMVGDDNGYQQEMLGSFQLNAPTRLAGVSDSITVTNRSFDYLAVLIDKPEDSDDYPIESCVVTRIVTSDKI